MHYQAHPPFQSSKLPHGGNSPTRIQCEPQPRPGQSPVCSERGWRCLCHLFSCQVHAMPLWLTSLFFAICLVCMFVWTSAYCSTCAEARWQLGEVVSLTAWVPKADLMQAWQEVPLLTDWFHCLFSALLFVCFNCFLTQGLKMLAGCRLQLLPLGVG